MKPLLSATRDWDLIARVAGAIGFGIIIWLILPGMVVTLDDDFWYLKSVVETYHRGRPWTTEYLVPWGAASSSLSATVAWLTGSMQLAIHGQLAVAGALAFLGLTLWLKDRQVQLGWSLTGAILMLGGPTVIFMLVMYTGVALYWGCLWMCVWAASRRSHFGFLLFWGIAMANRQSAIVWLALPGWWVLEQGWKQRDWKPIVTLVLALAWFLVLKLGMNPTTAQQWYTQSSFNLSRWGDRHITLGLSLAALAAGYGAAGILRPTQRPSFVMAAVAACLGAWVALLCMERISFSHSGYTDDLRTLYVAGTGAILGLGIMLGWQRPAGGPLLAAIGCCLLLTLYSGKFDYYFIEIAWWGVVACLMGGDKAQPSTAANPVVLRTAVVGMTILLVMLNGRFMVRTKLDQHRAMAMNTLYERAYRDGSLKLHETGLSTMGHLGWWLEDDYRTRAGEKAKDLAGFIRMCDAWDSEDGGTRIVAEHPKSFKKVSDWLPLRSSKLLARPEARELGSMTLRILFFWEAKYRLKQIQRKNPPPRVLEIDYANFKQNRFPLNDQEWLTLLNGGSI